MTQLTLLRDFMGDTIPQDINTLVTAAIADGDIERAAQILADFRKEQADEEIEIRVKMLATNAMYSDFRQGAMSQGMGNYVSGRANGGYQHAGELGWVGERGPELWLPDTGGTVIPADVSAAIVAGAGGRQSGGVNIGTINQYGLAPDGGGRALGRELRRRERDR